MNAMRPQCLENKTEVSEFVLQGFHVLPELKPYIFIFFFAIYIITVVWNMLIVAIVSVEDNLQSPMYYFLGNLSFLEIWYMTTTVPTILSSLVREGCTVTRAACVTQFYFLVLLAATECLLLAVMAYDRYLAICLPLHYSLSMDQFHRIQLVAISWVIGCIFASVTNCLVSTLEFPDHNEINHFFCDFKPFVKTACSDTFVAEVTTFAFSFTVSSVPLLLIIVSYFRIIWAIMRISSSTGRNKAFSTCSSHLAVVIMYFGALIFLYVVPSNGQTIELNKVLSLLYTVATPLFNPIIYTLRNKDIRKALTNYLRKRLPIKRV
ncbi:olfactory receptor 11L1-like [Lissotriton helveticus]